MIGMVMYEWYYEYWTCEMNILHYIWVYTSESLFLHYDEYTTLYMSRYISLVSEFTLSRNRRNAGVYK